MGNERAFVAGRRPAESRPQPGLAALQSCAHFRHSVETPLGVMSNLCHRHLGLRRGVLLVRCGGRGFRDLSPCVVVETGPFLPVPVLPDWKSSQIFLSRICRGRLRGGRDILLRTACIRSLWADRIESSRRHIGGCDGSAVRHACFLLSTGTFYFGRLGTSRLGATSRQIFLSNRA